MEKATDVYNKLKLRFVGKADIGIKSKSEDKETEDNVKESQNSGAVYFSTASDST